MSAPGVIVSNAANARNAQNRESNIAELYTILRAKRNTAKRVRVYPYVRCGPSRERKRLAGLVVVRGVPPQTAVGGPAAAGDELGAIFRLPDAVTPVAVVPIGRPARRLGPPRRKPVAEVTYRDAFGQPW